MNPIDPWALQRANMKQSDQALPDTPMITRDSLLYYALILEECAELGKTLRECMETAGVRGNIPSIDHDMKAASLAIRERLKMFNPDFRLRLHVEDMREILDGTTDLTVVNSGFALACGLNGPEAYRRVQVSNLSKANPATGKIDKTPDGKWFKGVNYAPPRLDDLCGGAA